MKVVHVFNMANDAYNIVKFMRAADMDVDLILNKQDFGMAFPQWEDGLFERGADPYSLDARLLDSIASPHKWIKIWDQTRFGRGLIGKAASRIDLYRLVQGYDIVEAHVPFALYAQFLHTPYVVYDAGWVRYFPFETDTRSMLARRGYMKASVVLVTNPDTFFIFDRLPYVKRKLFMPFVIDFNTYKPMKTDERWKYDCDLLLFAPCRQNWREKGNDKMLVGLMEFAKKTRVRPLLIAADWGPDAENSKRLANRLGISKHVRWIKPVNKRELVRYYNTADVILDQFVLGSYGTAAPEAMACGRPVIMYYSEAAFLRAFGELPPMLNAFSHAEIANRLSQCLDSGFRKDVAARCMDWVARHHNWQRVVDRHREVYSFVQGECRWEDIAE